MTKLKYTLLALSVIGLQACGGGGGGGGTPALSLESVQGVYDTTTYSGSGLGGATQAVRPRPARAGSLSHRHAAQAVAVGTVHP